MLEFIKRIFREQEVKKAIQIRLMDCEEWLNENSKPLMEEVMLQAEGILMKIGEEIQRVRFNVQALENAKLQNPNIPFKAKQYMEGNRKAYIKAINSFMGYLDINNKDYFYLLDFCGKFDSLIGDLNNGTLRSYTILQEFFANETGNVAENIRNIDLSFRELKSALGNEKVAAVSKAAEKIKSLNAKAMQKINLEMDFKKTEAELKLSESEKASLMSEIKSFNESCEHSEFMKLNGEKESKAGAFYNDENLILQSFSILEKPLRKYSHMEFKHEELVLDYLRQPVESLFNDKSLEILQILGNLENFLKENRLHVDDKKKEKSFEEIKRLNREFLQQFMKKHSSFKAEMEELESKVKSSGVPEKLRKYGRQLKDINLSIEKSSNDFGQLKNEISKAANSMLNLKNEIEADIKNIFREDVNILER